MRYKPSYATALFGDGTKVTSALHKKVVIDFIESDKSILIVTMESKNECKGFVQEAISLMMKRHKGKKFFATVPLHPAAKHIFDKMGIGYPKEEGFWI